MVAILRYPQQKRMSKVTEILSGNTIRLSSSWEWGGSKGNTIIIDGYDLNKSSFPEGVAEPFAKQRLISILQGKEISLHTPASLVNGILKCRVFLDGVDITQYFPEFQKG